MLPAATETMRLEASSSSGSGTSCVPLPLPQRPYWPLPHVNTTPLSLDATMKPLPTAIWRMRTALSASTSAGRGCDTLLPWPRPPLPADGVRV